jgi:predicted XRE-type DNA-binding protein
MSTDEHDDPTPEEWLASADDDLIVDEPWSHPDPEFDALRDQAHKQRRAEHEIVTSLGELRRAAGITQVDVAERWGRGQPQVSKVERSDLSTVELTTLAGYVRAIGGRLTVTVEAGDHVFYEDLVGS